MIKLHRSIAYCVLLGCLIGLARPGSAQLMVGAAADLGPALSELTNNYHQKGGGEVRVSLGSSGNLTQQIKNGAPFDVFLSADEDYPKQLIDGGYAEPSSLYRYAVGKLVLWVPSNSQLDLRRGIEVLLDPTVKKIAIANPAHAPYGRAAVAALKHYSLYERLKPRLVLGENVAQAAEFVESGNAQVGLVALAHALAPAMKNKGRYAEVSSGAYSELDQAAIILSHSSHKKEASSFLDYLKTTDARAILARYGFATAGEKH